MAAFTVNSTKRSIFGDRRVQILSLTGASGSTYTPNWDVIQDVQLSPGSIVTGYTIAGVPAVLTLTTGGGALAAETVTIYGR